MQQGSKRLVFLGGAVALCAVLYIAASKQGGEKKQDQPTEKLTPVFSFTNILEQSKNKLTIQDRASIDVAETMIQHERSVTNLEALGKIWDRLQLPPISSHYYEEIALIHPTEKTWIDAAYRYFDAYTMSEDSTIRQGYADRAINCYEQALTLNPKNLDVKTDLGICYAQATPNPMKGILLLREVVAENPKHEIAQYNLGILSVKSGQLEKAVERFETVLSINPKRTEARFLLARAYADLGKKEDALKNLKIVKSEISDPKLTADIDKLISQINNH